MHHKTQWGCTTSPPLGCHQDNTLELKLFDLLASWQPMKATCPVASQTMAHPSPVWTHTTPETTFGSVQWWVRETPKGHKISPQCWERVSWWVPSLLQGGYVIKIEDQSVWGNIPSYSKYLLFSWMHHLQIPISIPLCYWNHQEGFLNVTCQCLSVSVKSQQDVRDLLVELRSSIETIVEGWPIGFCRNNPSFHCFFVLLNNCVVWQVACLSEAGLWNLDNLHNSLLGLVLNGVVILLKCRWVLSEMAQQALESPGTQLVIVRQSRV